MPSLGRFLQPDRIGYSDGLNVYAYVDNHPLDLTDPSGMEASGDKSWQILSNEDKGSLNGGTGLEALQDPSQNSTPVSNTTPIAPPADSPSIVNIPSIWDPITPVVDSLTGYIPGAIDYLKQPVTPQRYRDNLKLAGSIILDRYNGNLLKGIVTNTILTKIGAPAVVRFIITKGGILDLGPDLNRINQGIKDVHRHDFGIYKNVGPAFLPKQAPSHYQEHTVRIPGADYPGASRIVTGKSGERYYTPDHYQTFINLK